jgi:hypothetical protein
VIALDDEQAQRLGAAIRRARRELRDPPQAEIAIAAGLSVATFQKLEGGTPGRYQPRTLDKLDRGLQWQEGSAERVIAGGSPLPLGAPRATVSDRVDEDGRPYRRVDVFMEDNPSDDDTEHRARWIEIWDALATQSPARARGALKIAETLLLFPETTDPDEW